MGRRDVPHPLAAKIGARVRTLREGAGITQEKLAYGCGFSKGQLSTLEHGLAIPTATTLEKLAESLGLLPLDLLTFPEDDERQRLVDLIRQLTQEQIHDLVLRVEGLRAKR